MTRKKNFSLFCKISPVFHETVFEEYLVSIDLCCPVSFIIHQSESSLLDKQNVDFNNYTIEEVDSEDKTKENTCFCSEIIDSNMCTRKIKIELDVLLFSCIMFELKRSRTFRSNILSKFYIFSQKNLKDGHTNSLVTCPFCERTMLLMSATVYLNQPKKNILDYIWNKKIQVLVNEKCELENAMAWLSTLGGAFSALGDEFIECAEKAALISVQQFCIALRLGDPITICRCKIYLAMSLLQREQYAKTKKLIRELYQFATGPEGSKDFKLKNMCIAVWNRLKYVLSLRRSRHMHNAVMDSQYE